MDFDELEQGFLLLQQLQDEETEIKTMTARQNPVTMPFTHNNQGSIGGSGRNNNHTSTTPHRQQQQQQQRPNHQTPLPPSSSMTYTSHEQYLTLTPHPQEPQQNQNNYYQNSTPSHHPSHPSHPSHHSLKPTTPLPSNFQQNPYTHTTNTLTPTSTYQSNQFSIIPSNNEATQQNPLYRAFLKDRLLSPFTPTAGESTKSTKLTNTETFGTIKPFNTKLMNRIETIDAIQSPLQAALKSIHQQQQQQWSGTTVGALSRGSNQSVLKNNGSDRSSFFKNNDGDSDTLWKNNSSDGDCNDDNNKNNSGDGDGNDDNKNNNGNNFKNRLENQQYYTDMDDITDINTNTNSDHLNTISFSIEIKKEEEEDDNSARFPSSSSLQSQSIQNHNPTAAGHLPLLPPGSSSSSLPTSSTIVSQKREFLLKTIQECTKLEKILHSLQSEIHQNNILIAEKEKDVTLGNYQCFSNEISPRENDFINELKSDYLRYKTELDLIQYKIDEMKIQQEVNTQEYNSLLENINQFNLNIVDIQNRMEYFGDDHYDGSGSGGGGRGSGGNYIRNDDKNDENDENYGNNGEKQCKVDLIDSNHDNMPKSFQNPNDSTLSGYSKSKTDDSSAMQQQQQQQQQKQQLKKSPSAVHQQPKQQHQKPTQRYRYINYIIQLQTLLLLETRIKKLVNQLMSVSISSGNSNINTMKSNTIKSDNIIDDERILTAYERETKIIEDKKNEIEIKKNLLKQLKIDFQNQTKHQHELTKAIEQLQPKVNNQLQSSSPPLPPISSLKQQNRNKNKHNQAQNTKQAAQNQTVQYTIPQGPTKLVKGRR